MGRRRASERGELFLTSADRPPPPRHVFYARLSALLAEAGFDRFVEDPCRPHYADEVGRPSLPPGTRLRMRCVGYFEEIDSPRGIAGPCADRFSRRARLAIPVTDVTRATNRAAGALLVGAGIGLGLAANR